MVKAEMDLEKRWAFQAMCDRTERSEADVQAALDAVGYCPSEVRTWLKAHPESGGEDTPAD